MWLDLHASAGLFLRGFCTYAMALIHVIGVVHMIRRGIPRRTLGCNFGGL